MASPQILTKWQRRHKELLEEALLNYDIYQEIIYIRRDTNSPLKVNDSDEYLNERVLRLINKYNLEIIAFDVLKKYCLEGEPPDYGLIPKRRPDTPKPKNKVHPEAKLHRTIYDMWIQQLKSIAEITDILREKHIINGYTRIDDIQRVSKIVKRMNAKDANRGKDYGPAPGRRLKKS